MNLASQYNSYPCFVCRYFISKLGLLHPSFHLVVCRLGLQAGSRTKPVVQSRSGLGRLGVLARLTAPSSNMEYGPHRLASSAAFGPWRRLRLRVLHHLELQLLKAVGSRLDSHRIVRVLASPLDAHNSSTSSLDTPTSLVHHVLTDKYMFFSPQWPHHLGKTL